MKLDLEKLGIDNFSIYQPKNSFRFGTDSIYLAKFIYSQYSNIKSGERIIELCAGTGVISIYYFAMLCKLQDVFAKNLNMYLVEIQDFMVDILQKNINLNNLNNNFFAIKENLKNHSSIKEKIGDLSTTVDCIICNPPYIPKKSGLDCKDYNNFVARYETNFNLDELFFSCNKLLKSGGKVFMVHKKERLNDLIYYSRKNNIELKKIQFVVCKEKDKISFCLLEFVKNGKSELKFLNNIYV